MAFVVTFVVGYMLGVFIDMPNINSTDAAGTISRVNNYRNTNATESDITLKQDLLKDKKLQASMVNYLNYYYAQSLAYAQTTAYALEQAAAVPSFATQCDKLDAMKKYGQFLENSRKTLLMASLHCKSAESADPSALRNSLNQALNVISRMGQYQSMVLTFIDQLDAFLSKNNSKSYNGLCNAYDQLLFDQVSGALISKDKVLESYLSKKQFYAAEQKDQQTDVKAAMMGDLKTLNDSYPRDLEKLSCLDKETLGLLDKGNLDSKDVEKLGIWDAEKLGSFALDVEKLGRSFDAEKLGFNYTDAEKLGGVSSDLINDSEQLGLHQCVSCQINDIEQLGGVSDLINDSEQLGINCLQCWLNDSE